jgi:hypothetical protein
MMATGIHALFVDGYIKRWRGLLDEPEIAAVADAVFRGTGSVPPQ